MRGAPLRPDRGQSPPRPPANTLHQVLLTKNVVCIAVNRPPAASPHDPPFVGLFDVRLLTPVPRRRAH